MDTVVVWVCSSRKYDVQLQPGGASREHRIMTYCTAALLQINSFLLRDDCLIPGTYKQQQID